VPMIALEGTAAVTNQVGGANAASGAVALRATATAVDNKRLRIAIEVDNRGNERIYVLDRLWMLDRSNNIVADPEGAYRFIVGDTLRILLGNCPLPRMKSVLYRNVPYATLVEPGTVYRRELDYPLPVREYSAYFKGETASNYADARLDAVEVFVDYIADDPALAKDTSPLEGAHGFDTPGYWERSQRLRSGRVAIAAPAKKRTDPFDRLFLPDENPDQR
jgi:hypothetical protein